VSASRQAGDVEGFCEWLGSAVEIPGRGGVGREGTFQLFRVVDIEVNLSDLGRGGGKKNEHLARLVGIRQKYGI
jgi:hypothetical protein